MKSLRLSIETRNLQRQHEEYIAAFKSNKIPSQFQRLYLVSSFSNLDSWLECIANNINFFKEWIKEGKNPRVFDLQSFVFPQGFLSSVLQTYSRKHIIPLHQLAFDFEVCGDEENVKIEDNDECAYVKGRLLILVIHFMLLDLLIEGGEWNPK